MDRSTCAIARAPQRFVEAKLEEESTINEFPQWVYVASFVGVDERAYDAGALAETELEIDEGSGRPGSYAAALRPFTAARARTVAQAAADEAAAQGGPAAGTREWYEGKAGGGVEGLRALIKVRNSARGSGPIKLGGKKADSGYSATTQRAAAEAVTAPKAPKAPKAAAGVNTEQAPPPQGNRAG